MKTYGERLAFAIARANSSQAELARLVGIKQQSVQYLCGPKAQGSKYTTDFARILKVRVEWLANNEGSVAAEDVLDQLPPHEKAALLLLRGLTDAQQKEALKNLETQKRQNLEIYEALASQQRTG